MRSQPPQAAAIYTRISHDPSGDRLGVQRQEADCIAEASRRGWVVAEVYEDDDESAHDSRHVRPAYQRLLRDLAAGARDGVLIWRLDRLHRQPGELEEFIVVCDKQQVSLATVTGDVDLSTTQGRLLARAWGAFAAHECEVRGERLSRAARERAEHGIMRPGGSRPYGYSKDGMKLSRREAAVVREAAQRVLAGDSLRGIAADFNARGIATSARRGWTSATLRRMLLNPRLAGWSTYHHEIVGAGTWPRILTRIQSDRLCVLLTDPQRRFVKTHFQHNLLRGLVMCARCKRPMRLEMDSGKVRRYNCRLQPGVGNCGRVSIKVVDVEAAVLDLSCRRLDSTCYAVARATDRVNNEESRRAMRRVTEKRQQLEVLARDYAQGALTRLEWLAVRPALLKAMQQADTSLVTDRIDSVVAPFVGRSGELRSQWARMHPDRQRAVIEAVLHAVMILPASSGRGGAAARVRPWWHGESRPKFQRVALIGVAERRARGDFRACSVAGCEREYVARGFCNMHLYRVEKLGEPGGAEPLRHVNQGHSCANYRCEKEAVTRGMCEAHYQRWLRRDPNRPRCTIPGCERAHIARGRCMSHYQQWRKAVAADSARS